MSWVETDEFANFDLRVNRTPFLELPEHDKSRELDRDTVFFFKADLLINGCRVTYENHPFEYKQGLLAYMIKEATGDDKPVSTI